MSSFKPGDSVEALCYKKGCESISIPVVLGEEGYISPGGPGLPTGVGRLRWPVESDHAVFTLSKFMGGSGDVHCPNCKTHLGDVIIITPPQGEPIIFGYDPDPG